MQVLTRIFFLCCNIPRSTEHYSNTTTMFCVMWDICVLYLVLITIFMFKIFFMFATLFTTILQIFISIVLIIF